MADWTGMEITTKDSPRSVSVTVSRLTSILAAKGLKVFAVIDQSAEASQVGLQVRETTFVLFGSPAAGTPVMAAAPLAALDLPLKVLIWADDGQTKVSYYGPAALATLRPRRRPGRRARGHRPAHRRGDRSVDRVPAVQRLRHPGRLLPHAALAGACTQPYRPGVPADHRARP